jgi:hypothetical protein
MQELLFGSWSAQITAYSKQYPWRAFAAVLVAAIVVMQLRFGKWRSSSGEGGDIGGFDFGDGDGCGD